jgi:GNAT superfamily N-acetyltransferase
MQQRSSLISTQSMCSVRAPGPAHYEKMAVLAGQLGYPCTGEQIRMRLAEMEASEQYAVYIAQLPGGQIAGWIGAYMFRTVELDHHVEIRGLVVDEQVRSRGIGKALLAAVEGWARSMGCDVVSVHSNVKRDRAHRFYLRNGYEHVKTQKQFRKRLRKHPGARKGTATSRQHAGARRRVGRR